MARYGFAHLRAVNFSARHRGGAPPGRLAHGNKVSTLAVAATALEHGLTVATRNVSDFEATGVPALDPFHVGVRIPVKPSNRSNASRSPIPIDAERPGLSVGNEALGAIANLSVLVRRQLRWRLSP